MQAVQVKMARAALGLSVDQLASKAGVSHVDVAQIEAGGGAENEAEAKLRNALEGSGIEWIGDDGVRYKGGAPEDGTIAVEDLNSYNDE
jgi:transcriptional regulator with XRE-family HTH domain